MNNRLRVMLCILMAMMQAVYVACPAELDDVVKGLEGFKQGLLGIQGALQGLSGAPTDAPGAPPMDAPPSDAPPMAPSDVPTLTGAAVEKKPLSLAEQLAAKKLKKAVKKEETAEEKAKREASEKKRKALDAGKNLMKSFFIALVGKLQTKEVVTYKPQIIDDSKKNEFIEQMKILKEYETELAHFQKTLREYEDQRQELKSLPTEIQGLEEAQRLIVKESGGTLSPNQFKELGKIGAEWKAKTDKLASLEKAGIPALITEVEQGFAELQKNEKYTYARKFLERRQQLEKEINSLKIEAEKDKPDLTSITAKVTAFFLDPELKLVEKTVSAAWTTFAQQVLQAITPAQVEAPDIKAALQKALVKQAQKAGQREEED